MKLLLKTLIAFLLGMIITGAMLFLPAGTWDYPGAWLFMALLFTPILLMGIVLMVKNPELLRKRLAMKEREKTQQGVVALSGLLLVASFIVAGIDYRFGWSHVSHAVVIIASAVLLIGYALYAEVLAKRLRAPAPLFLIPAFIPSIPGSNLYYTMAAAVGVTLDRTLPSSPTVVIPVF